MVWRDVSEEEGNWEWVPTTNLKVIPNGTFTLQILVETGNEDEEIHHNINFNEAYTPQGSSVTPQLLLESSLERKGP